MVKLVRDLPASLLTDAQLVGPGLSPATQAKYEDGDGDACSVEGTSTGEGGERSHPTQHLHFIQ